MPIRNLADLIAAGATSTVEYYIDSGRPRADLTSMLQRRYGVQFQARQQSVDALLNRVRQATQIADRYTTTGQIDVRNIPRADGIGRNRTYAYTVMVTTPHGDSSKPKIYGGNAFPITLRSDSILSMAELARRAREQAQNFILSRRQANGYERFRSRSLGDDTETLEVQLMGVYRS